MLEHPTGSFNDLQERNRRPLDGLSDMALHVHDLMCGNQTATLIAIAPAKTAAINAIVAARRATRRTVLAEMSARNLSRLR